MLKRISMLLALALATGLVAAACGDDDETTSATTTTTASTGAAGATTGEPLTKEEFIAQADAICESGDAQIEAAADDFFPAGGSPGKAEEEAFVVEVVIPNIQEQIDGISALTPPEGDEDEVQAIVDAAQDGLDELEEDPTALTGGGSGANPLAEGTRLAKQYGLEVCGQG